MPQIGPLEILMVAVVALIVFGPEKLPEIARTVGKTLADFRRVMDEARGEFRAGLDLDDEPPDPHPISEALDDLPDILDGPLYQAGESNPGEGPSPAGTNSSASGDRSSLTPIPMTLDDGSRGEEPDKP
jgi:sec-independent protein translocase protein TatB